MPGHDAVPARDPAVQHKRRVSSLQCAAGAPGRLPAGWGSALTLRWARPVCGCFAELPCFFQEPANMNALRQRLPAGKAEVFTMRPFWGLFVEPKLLRALSARASPVPSVHAASLPQATRLPRAPPSLTAANTSPGGKPGGAAPCSALAAVTLPRQSECRVACGAPPPARYLPASPSHQPPCRPPCAAALRPRSLWSFSPGGNLPWHTRAPPRNPTVRASVPLPFCLCVLLIAT